MDKGQEQKLDQVIKVVSEHIGVKWKALARELKLKPTDMDAVAHNNPYDLHEQIHDFFYRWKQQEGKDATVEKLIDGLRAAKLDDCVSLVMRKLSGTSVTQGYGSPLGGAKTITAPLAAVGGTTVDQDYVRRKRLERFGSCSDGGNPAATTRSTSMISTDSTSSNDLETDMLVKSPTSAIGTVPSVPEMPTAESFEKDDMVQWERGATTYYGVVKWVGTLPDLPDQFAGIEVDDELDEGHSGEFNGVKYFSCAPRRGIFLRFDMLKRDDRFDSGVSETTKQELRQLQALLDQTEEDSGQTEADSVAVDTNNLDNVSAGASPGKTPLRLGGADPLSNLNLESAPLQRDDSPRKKTPPPLLLTQLLENSPGSPPSSGSAGEITSLLFHFPGDQVGLIIGRDGKNIQEVQRKTNTKIDIRKPMHDMSMNGKAVIIGTEENCKEALCMILSGVRRKIARHIAITEVMEIPNRSMCGRIIGAKGRTRAAIEKLSGARIHIDSQQDIEGPESFLELLLGDVRPSPRRCEISGTPEQVEAAKELIQKAMEGKDIARTATLAAVIHILIREFQELGFEFPGEDTD